MTRTLEALDRLLQGPPEPRVFYSICDLLDAWPQATLDEAIRRASAVLGSWPLEAEGVRPWEFVAPLQLPPAWVDALLAGEDSPRLALGRVLFAVAKPAALAERIAASAHLQNLVGLRLVSCRIGDAGAAALARPRSAFRLSWLSLRGAALGAAGLASLAASDTSRTIEHLLLEGSHLGAAAFALPDGGGFPRLRTLLLNREDLGADGAALLARTGAGQHLEGLYLCDDGLGDEGVEGLARWELDQLRSLNLAENGIADGVGALASWRSTQRLEELWLCGNPIGSSGAAALAGAPLMSSLRKLDLSRCALGPEGLRALGSAPAGALEELILSGNDVGDDGVRALAGSPAFAHLKRLALGANQISNAGLEALVSSPHLRGLEDLELVHNDDLDEAHYEALAASPIISDALRARWETEAASDAEDDA